MAFVNVVNLHEIQNRFRIEAEFYRPDYVECYKIIERLPHLKLRQNCLKISDGTHFTPRYINNGVKFYSAVNVQENIFAYDNLYKFISLQEHKVIHKRCPVQTGDVLIRKVGVGPRWCCVVPVGLEQFSVFVSVALVRPTKKLIPHYLSTFINSKYGQLQLLRLNKGISQPDLHLEDIGELIVPAFNEKIQNEISDIVLKAQVIKESSRQIYTQAQRILEDELGLDKLHFEKTVGYTARFSITGLADIFDSGRIDAQCFSPAAIFYEAWLIKHATCNRLNTLLFSTVKGRQQVETTGGTTDYCSIKHISGREIVGASKANSVCGTPSATKKDLLLAITGATIGKIGIVNRYDNLVFSGDMLKLSVNSNIDPHYLLLVLDHDLGQVQFNRWITGSTNGHLAPRDVGRVLVPRIASEVEDQISVLVAESLEKRQESERLLDQAKSRVEQLIEKAVQK